MAKEKYKTSHPAGLMDFFIWERFSSLQKLFCIAMGVIAMSWLLSQWSLLVLFMLCSTAAFYLSILIRHHETGPFSAENLVFHLESLYIWGRSKMNWLNAIFKTHLGHIDLDVEDGALAFHPISQDPNIITGSDNENWLDKSVSSDHISIPVRSEINSLQLLIIRDFIQSWYSTFSYNNQFLKEAKYTIQQSCNTITYSVMQQNRQIVTASLLKMFRVHVTMCMKAKSVFESHKIHPQAKVPNKSILRYSSVEEAFEKEFGFHEAVTCEDFEVNYIRGILTIILSSVLPKATTEGICTRTLLVEIMTNNVVLPLVQMVSDPNWLMEKIILLTSNENIGHFDKKEQNSVSLDFHQSLQCLAKNISEENSIIDSSWMNKGSESKESDNETKSVSHPLDFVDHIVSSDINGKQLQCERMEKDNLLTSPKMKEDKSNKCGNGKENCVINEKRYCDSADGEDETVPMSNNMVDMLKPVPDVCDKETDKENVLINHEPNVNTTEDIFEKSFRDHGKKMTDMPEESDAELHNMVTESYENMEVIESDPQQILSYNKSFSVPTSNSGITTVSPETEIVSSSFPKLLSLKSFFVDSFKPGSKNSNVEKPKTLDLFPDKLLKPLSWSRNTSVQEKSPPVVLVDGKPADNLSWKNKSLHQSHSSTSDSESSPPLADSEISPGFFSNVQPFFTKSSSQNDLSVSNLDISDESPGITPSPTGQSVFDLDSSEGPQKKKDKVNADDMTKSIVSGDQRIFQDISIPKAVTFSEFRSSSQYSLYVIEFTALYFNEEGKSVLKSGEVKRRHREFTNLQSRLESHPSYKKFLKNIRRPRRWPTFPFKSLDKETVESRRQLLEKYLKDLIEIEAICNGPDLREFLAYEGDSHIAFVKKSPDITVPRIDKMLMRGVNEVVDKLRLIPNIPSEVMSGFRSKESVDEKLNQQGANGDGDMIEINPAFDQEGVKSLGSILNMICCQLAFNHDNGKDDDSDLFNVSHVIKDHKSFERTQETYRQEIDKLLSKLPKNQRDGTSQAMNEEDNENQLTDVSTVVLELLVQGLQGHNNWICTDHIFNLFKALLGKALSSYMESAIKNLTSDSKLVIYLRLVRETIWPQGQLWSDSDPPKTEEEKAATREKALRCLTNFFPVLLHKIVGEDDFKSMLEVYIDCLHYPKLNRHLFYHLLDFIVEELFPEATSCEMLQTLLFSNTSSDCYI